MGLSSRFFEDNIEVGHGSEWVVGVSLILFKIQQNIGCLDI